MSFKQWVVIGAMAATAAIGSTAAKADVLTGTFGFVVTTGATGSGFSTLPGVDPFTGQTATANFTYTGALNFNNPAAQNAGSSGDLNSTFFNSAGVGSSINASSYHGSGNFVAGNDDYSTIGGFLAGSGSASNFLYGSLYTITLGQLAAGTILTITHDDGVSVFDNGIQVNSTVSGPTSVVTDTVDITTTGDITLYYSRQNGTPSILQVSAVPEPSTWAMMILGFVGVGFMAYRRKQNGPSLRLV
jgi:PEP-CTERM motif